MIILAATSTGLFGVPNDSFTDPQPVLEGINCREVTVRDGTGYVASADGLYQCDDRGEG